MEAKRLHVPIQYLRVGQTDRNLKAKGLQRPSPDFADWAAGCRDEMEQSFFIAQTDRCGVDIKKKRKWLDYRHQRLKEIRDAESVDCVPQIRRQRLAHTRMIP
jgi:hypothetical protein